VTCAVSINIREHKETGAKEQVVWKALKRRAVIYPRCTNKIKAPLNVSST